MNENERIAKLPLWARQLIAGLRQRVTSGQEQLIAELVKLRPQVDLLKSRNEALTELLDCAARGQHKTAAQIMEIIRAYDLTLTPRTE